MNFKGSGTDVNAALGRWSATIVVIEHIDYPPGESKELSFQLLKLVLKV